MRVMTWNMQEGLDIVDNKWYTDVKRVLTQLTEPIDVLLLQEVGTPPQDALIATAPNWMQGFSVPGGLPWGFFKWPVGTVLGESIRNVLWVMLDFSGGANNLAIVWDPARITCNGLIYVKNPMGGRPLIGLATDSCNVMNIHALSPHGDDAPRMMELAATTGASWFVAGDFHRTDEFTLPANANFCRHDQPSDGWHHTADKYGVNSGPAIDGKVFTEFLAPNQYSVVYTAPTQR